MKLSSSSLAIQLYQPSIQHAPKPVPSKIAGLQQDIWQFSDPEGKGTINDVHALEQELPSRLDPKGSYANLCDMPRIFGVGSKDINQGRALVITAPTPEDRDVLVKKILKQSGAKEEYKLQKQYGGVGERIISIPFRDKNIPISLSVAQTE